MEPGHVRTEVCELIVIAHGECAEARRQGAYVVNGPPPGEKGRLLIALCATRFCPALTLHQNTVGHLRWREPTGMSHWRDAGSPPSTSPGASAAPR